MKKPKRFKVAEWVSQYLLEESPRSRSLITSAFGDSIAPYAEGIWLGELIQLMAPLGMNERLVRTSAFRLIDEGWLKARREGRRSYYTLTDTGRARFEKAYSHIYEPPPSNWDGQWTLVLLPRQAMASCERSEFKRELLWSGFSPVSPGVLLHPCVSAKDINAMAEPFGLADQIVVMRCRDADVSAARSGDRTLLDSWNLDDVCERYTRFIELFEPLLPVVVDDILDAQEGFLVQTLLIHSYRRANLHDPRLPLCMLPKHWPGLRAFEICREIYSHTYSLAAEHLRSLPEFESMDPLGGRLSMSVRQRFGGLMLDTIAA